MTQWLGDYTEDETVYFLWSTNDRSGASVTRTVDGTVSVYKDNGVAQSVAGVTDTEDFDGLTGIHACTIDLSADAFYATGADYAVVLSAATIDGQTVNAVLAHFSIENRFQEVDVVKWLGQACAAVSQNGVPEVDVTYWLGQACAAVSQNGVPEVDVTYIEGAAVNTAAAQLGTNVVQIEGADATDTIDARVLAQLQGIELDHLMSVACDGNLITGNVVDNSALACIAAIAGDISDFSGTTDSLEAIGSGVASTTAALIADAVWDEAAASHVAAGSFGKLAADVPTDVWAETLEAGAPANAQTAIQFMRLMAAALFGKEGSAGSWGARDLGDTKDRIVGTLDSSGKRSSVTTLDGS